MSPDGVLDRIWVQSSGDREAPLVALVHGTMDRSAGLLKLSRRLDGGFHVVRYDRRGYGRSVEHPGPYDLAGHVADLADVLDGRRALVVGHSFGGNVALALAQRHPDLVAAVVTYEAPVSWLPWWPRGRRADGQQAASLDAAERAERFVVELIGRRRWDELPERTRAARRREGTTLVAELRSLAAAPPWDGALVGVPVVVGVGELAADHHRRAAQLVASSIPAAELVELEGCAHDAPTAAPELFASSLVDRAARRAGPPWSIA